MDLQLKKLVDLTKEKIGLHSYRLHTANIYFHKNIFNGTDYTLSMEWFPEHITERTEDGLNPTGTAVVDLDLRSRRLKSIIFVGGKAGATTLAFDKHDSHDIIHWIEKETGLTYHHQFQIKKEEETKRLFQSGVASGKCGFTTLRKFQYKKS